jgi:potassium-transporting ATPase KdpC subunit
MESIIPQTKQRKPRSAPVRALIIVGILVLLCGVVYPLLVTGIGQLAFPFQANGSMLVVDGKVIGSELIGQDFTDPRFFHGRVSGVGYNTYDGETAASAAQVASGSANLGPSDPLLVVRVQKDLQSFLSTHPNIQLQDIPADLMTSSGSGLDPDITLGSALIQIPAISTASGISEDALKDIVMKCMIEKTLGFLGNTRVNVLKANLLVLEQLGS